MYALENELPAGTYPEELSFTNNGDGTATVLLKYAHREGLDVTRGRLKSTVAPTTTNLTRQLESFALTMAVAGVISDVAYDAYADALGTGDPTT